MPSLCELAREGHLLQLKEELHKEPSAINGRDMDNRTPLHWAATKHSDVVGFLIENGADVSVADEDGWTALHIAASAGVQEAVQLLIRAGADVNARNSRGQTPLHYAGSRHHFDIIDMLTNNHCEVDARDENGSTALHRAAATGHLQTVLMLLKHNANPCAMDGSGDTPLHLAAAEDHVHVLMHLLKECACDPTKVNKAGKNAYDVATKTCKRNIAQYAKESGEFAIIEKEEEA